MVGLPGGAVTFVMVLVSRTNIEMNGSADLLTVVFNYKYEFFLILRSTNI